MFGLQCLSLKMIFKCSLVQIKKVETRIAQRKIFSPVSSLLNQTRLACLLRSVFLDNF